MAGGRGQVLLRKDNLNHSSVLAGSELAPTAPEETRRSFHGHSHERCLPPYPVTVGAGQCRFCLRPSATQGCSCHGHHARVTLTACSTLVTAEQAPWAPQSQNRLRNRGTLSQPLPFPSLSIKPRPCGQPGSRPRCLLRAGRSPKRKIHICLRQKLSPHSAGGMQSRGAPGC